MEFFLSGHGAQNVGTQYKLQGDLVTFCAFGDALDIPTSWSIFDALCTNDVGKIGQYSYRRYLKGETIPNLTLYPTTDFTSGIFEVGQGKIPLQSLDSGQFTIKDFFTFWRGVDTVYWVACLS